MSYKDYIFTNSDSSLINAIRRIIISNIPSLAIDTVVIKENTTNIPDEIICHRIGQIPIIYNEKNKNVGVSLNMIGPCEVYSRDIKFENDLVEIGNKDIIIVKLNKNEKLIFEGLTEEGCAYEHSKWSVCTWKYEQIGDKDYKLSIKSNGSYKEKEIILNAFNILKNEINKYKKML